MKDLAYMREKLRRDAQELINHLDAAISADNDKERSDADQLAAIHVTLISLGAKDFVTTALETQGIDVPKGDE